MTSPGPYLLVFLLSLAIATTASAQDRQVPLDVDGSVMRIDADMAKRLGLFSDVAGFEEALLYQGVDSSFILEIFARREGARERLRRPMTALEAGSFRQSVTEGLRRQSPADLVDQRGRTGLLVGTTALGLGYYGWAIPAAADIDDFRAALGVYMLTSASAFFVPFFATQNGQVTEPQRDLTIYGGIKGIADGMFLYGLAAGSEGFDNDASGPLWSGVVFGVVEMFAGYAMAAQMDAPHVALITTGGVAGNGFGLGTAYLLDFDDFRGYAGLMLLGTAGGYVATHALYTTGKHTKGDAEVFSTTTFAGAYAPVGLLYLAGVEDDETLVASSMAGMLLGAWLGHRIAVGHDFTESQGMLTGVGTLASGLLGAGIGYLLSPSDSDDHAGRRAIGGGAIGVIGGFGIMMAILGDDARHHDQGTNWKLDVSPVGIAALAGKRRGIPSGMSIPILSVSAMW